MRERKKKEKGKERELYIEEEVFNVLCLARSHSSHSIQFGAQGKAELKVNYS